jgi:hypothetical protein
VLLISFVRALITALVMGGVYALTTAGLSGVALFASGFCAVLIGFLMAMLIEDFLVRTFNPS